MRGKIPRAPRLYAGGPHPGHPTTRQRAADMRGAEVDMAKGDRQKKSFGSKLLGLLNPIRDPSLLVAIILTVIEEGGSQANPPVWLLIGALNWIAVKAVIWLLVNFAFSAIYLVRKGFWVLRNPRLAWRLLDALGTEEIIIGGLRPDMFAADDGSLHAGQLGLAAGLVGGGYGAGAYGGALDGAGYNGYGGGGGNGYGASEYDEYADYQGNGYQGYDRQGAPSLRLDQQSEEVREMLSSYARLIEDWMAYTEEKWRAVSDSQLGWKQLRGRWNGWEEIFRDSFGMPNQDARALLAAGDPIARRFDNANSKGSAASAVACFLYDLNALRQAIVAMEGNEAGAAPRMGGIESRPQLSQRSVKAPIIRNPMIVDADR
jgi:hypothetical protein